ncbi:ribonuclease HIII [Evansella caseinilytica]|uniref:Ribonuclease HIII n=1 Tax=Evansella caseinilytica TaxID=1503961 RepID=A0A1H3TUH2_9BACI|nr:ribonuclease HIII [Evansella caseinilytica]SDZ53752.1 ribonuclease HIII [Evansella caseinilytica]
MSYEVLQVTSKAIDEMKKYYAADLKQSLPPGAVFAAKTKGVSITGYKSGKVLFQGKDAAAEAGRWREKASAPGAVSRTAAAPQKNPAGKAAKSAVDNHRFFPPANVAQLVLLGSDETGTGDYFGPMTVACAHLTHEQMKTMEHWGIRDSKTINDAVIRELAPKLVKECTYSLLVLHNEKYNSLQQKGMNQGEMKAMLHHQAIANVMKKCEQAGIEYSGVLIDQFVQPKRYFQYLKTHGKSWVNETPIYFATKAEGLHPAVAAASVLARYSFLTEMDKLEKAVGLPLPKGAGSFVDKAAKEILRQKGKEALYRCSKWHFANTQKALR